MVFTVLKQLLNIILIRAKRSNLAETAYLAGLPQVPNQYNIYDNPEGAEKRKDTVLYLMERHGRISKKK